MTQAFRTAELSCWPEPVWRSSPCAPPSSPTVSRDVTLFLGQVRLHPQPTLPVLSYHLQQHWFVRRRQETFHHLSCTTLAVFFPAMVGPAAQRTPRITCSTCVYWQSSDENEPLGSISNRHTSKKRNHVQVWLNSEHSTGVLTFRTRSRNLVPCVCHQSKRNMSTWWRYSERSLRHRCAK